MHKNVKYFGLYLLLAVLAYWQVSFFQNALKWDMVDCYLPWRSFVSDCIRNGHFPLWNPYQNFGYPIHADMRTIWAPEIWLVTLFGGYSIYTFHVLFIAYTTIAGFSMYLLSGLFIKNHKAAFFTGSVYMLSGYLTGHGQEIYTINSFTFIPLVLYHFVQLCNNPTIKRGSYLTVFLFIILTSAYQAHSFILLYLFIILFGYVIYDSYKKKNYKKVKQAAIILSAVAVILLVVFTPYIISLKQVFPYVTRLNSGVNADTTSILSFSPQSLLSLILPFAVIRDIEFFNTDLSMTNIYFGIIPLIYLVVFFVKRYRNSVFTIIFVFGIVALIASFGDSTPFRKVLYNYVPFMNLFKGSAYFRLFTLIGFCLASGYAFSTLLERKKVIILTSGMLLLIIVGFMVHAFPHIYFGYNSFINPEFGFVEDMTSKSTFYENIFLQGLVQIGFLLLLILLYVTNKATLNNVMWLSIINLILAVQFNIYSTTVSRFSPQGINRYVKTLPKGFPEPKKEIISKCTDRSVSHIPLWRNTSMLAKQVSGDSFNSFRLDMTNDFKTKYQALKDTVTNNYLIYFSDDILPLSAISDTNIKRTRLFVVDSVYYEYKPLIDTLNTLKGSYIINGFGPNHIQVSINTNKQAFLTLIQTNYPGWKASINGEPTDIIESNTALMSIMVPKGHNEIEFKYENKVLVKAFMFSAVVLLLLIALSLGFLFRDYKTMKC